MWNTINKNAFYVLETLTNEQENQLIQNIKNQVETLNIEEILLRTIRSELNVTVKLTKNNFRKTNQQSLFKSKIDYLELVRNISNNTKTPISFIVKIFNALSDDFKSKMLCNNPEQAQKQISEIINNNLISMLKTNIKYDGINGTGLSNIFKKKKKEKLI